MRLQIVLVVFALCSMRLCLTNGAPAGGSTTGEGSSPRSERQKPGFTPQENEFIQEAVNKAGLQKSSFVSWKTMAKEHGRRVSAKVEGFENKRSSESLRKHFDRYLKKGTTFKPKKNCHKHRYTTQEEEFINKELLNDSFRGLHLLSDEIWQEIARKHTLKREDKCEGFSFERSFSGLRGHFRLIMRPGGREAKEIKERFRHTSNFSANEEDVGTSNEGSSKRLLFDLNEVPNEEAEKES